ncbi:hypothetical protein LSAT2_023268 [Lamellibrachia satsuma]|nr:hypothetical protein LSAT2_023268 [Lamellibrachia satsuma]
MYPVTSWHCVPPVSGVSGRSRTKTADPALAVKGSGLSPALSSDQTRNTRFPSAASTYANVTQHLLPRINVRIGSTTVVPTKSTHDSSCVELRTSFVELRTIHCTTHPDAHAPEVYSSRSARLMIYGHSIVADADASSSLHPWFRSLSLV